MKALIVLLPLGLAACGSPGPAENKAAQLENAANVSTPEAAQVYNDAAGQIRNGADEDAEAEAAKAVNEAANASSRER